MTDDAAIRKAADRWGVPFEDLKARRLIDPAQSLDFLALLLHSQLAEVTERAGELAYLLQYEGDIFASAERYRTIRDSIVARAN